MPRSIAPSGAVLALLIVGPAWLAGQSQPSLGEDGEVGATFSLRSGVTWVSDGALPIAAVSGTLRLSTTMELGGEAVLGLGAIRLSPKDAPDRSELDTGYGGLLVRWRPAGDLPGLRWGGGLLLGAGSARIRSPLATATIVSENYFLIEPRFNLLARQDRSIRFAAEAGYRITLGFDAQPGIRLTELRGPALSLAAQYVRDP